MECCKIQGRIRCCQRRKASMEKSRTRVQSRVYKCSSICFRSEDSILQKPCVCATLRCEERTLRPRRAYEIKTLHNREPPPIEILEKLTAKGGDILSRTVENFRPPQKSTMFNGDSDSGGEGSKTPKDEKMDIDEPGSIGRSSRGESMSNFQIYHQLIPFLSGLRQAPPQRIPFQPDVSSSRQVRHSSGHAQSPQPAATTHTGYNYSASSNPNSASFTIANYEPRPQMPLTLRPIVTPSYNAAMFEERQKLARLARKVELGLVSPSTKGMMKPGGMSFASNK